MSGFGLPPMGGYERMLRQRPLGEAAGQDPLRQEPLRQEPLRITDRVGSESEGGAGAPATTFESALSDSLGAMRSMQQEVDDQYKSLMLGEDVELHDIMAAANKSEVMFNLMLEVRNKLVEAWEKLSRSAV